MNKILQTLENSLVITTKTCKNCKIEKDLNEFRRDNSGRFGRNKCCKICHQEMDRQWYERNRLKKIEKSKEWNKKNPYLRESYRDKEKRKN